MRENTKVEISSLKWELNAWVLYVTPCPKYSENAISRVAREERIPAKIYFISESEKDRYNVSIQATGYHINSVNQAVTKAALKLITKEEADLLISEAKKRYIIANADAIKNRNAILNPEHIRVINRRDYSIGDRGFLSTNMNFIGLGSAFKRTGYTNNSLTLHAGAACCAVTKNTVDVMVCIPKLWTTYFGYNENDIKAWFSFLEQCDINFEAYIESSTTLREVFGRSISSANTQYPNGNTIMSPDMECYKIVIKRQSYNLQTYMHFILVRYLYNNQYWNIPFIAMQIKINVGEELSFWECLILAHCNQVYYDYYCIVGNKYEQIALPDKNNTPKKIMTNLRNSDSLLNACYTYQERSLESISKYIRNGQYKELIELVNKNK